jgi:Peptidase family M28
MDQAGRTELIRELCSIEGRGPGTDAERRAANMLAGRLRGMGRRAEIEPTFVHPQYALVYALHAAVAVAGSVVATAEPAIGFALVLLAAVSAYLDLNTRFYLLRSLFFRRGSQNVVSPGPRPEAPARLILVAHYDAARTGYVFSRGNRFAKRLSGRARAALAPFRVFFWGGLVPLLPILGAQMAGADATWLSALQAIPTIILIISAFLMIDIALSDIVPGAYDNASGVAAVLSAAAELDADPPANLDVWVVLTCEESLCEGMRSYVRAHRKEMDRDRTFILNVDSVSHGDVTYEESEGAVVSYPLDAQLIELAEALGQDPRFNARPLRFPLLDDALPARMRGLRAITIRTTEDGLPAPWYHTPEDTPDRVDAAALTRATDFVVGLSRLVDRDLGRSAA